MKKLQILEPMQSGHHTDYVMALVPAIAQLKQDKVIDTAVFTVTPRHLQLLKESGHATRAESTVQWDASLCETSPGPKMAERKRLYESVRAAVSAQRADALICTSADYDVLPNALTKLRSDSRFWPAASAAMIHFGLPKEELRLKENLKRMAYELSWRFCSWKRLLIVNPLVYESLRARNRTGSGRYDLLPSPLPADLAPCQREARQALGLPIEGAYIGCVGMMDHRKAIPELLAAFAGSGLSSESRLLLAGNLDNRYKEILEREHAELLRAGRIIVINRTLSDEELLCGYSAVDLHSVLQYRRMNLSANVLRCVAVGRPYVSDRYGFTGMVAERFGAGIVCEVDNVASISAALRQGLAMSKGFVPNEAMCRLVEFHSQRNFAAVALESVLGPVVLDSLGPTIAGDRVYGAHM